MSFHTLTNPAAPIIVAVLFVAIWLGHASLRTMAETVRRLWIDQFGGGRNRPSPIG